MKRNVSHAKRRVVYNQGSVRINISLPPTLAQRVPELLNKHGFTGLSDYYQARMRKDLGIDLVS